MVLAPENPLVENLTTPEQKTEVENYIEETSKKTERDRMADVKNVSGAFTGSYADQSFYRKKYSNLYFRLRFDGLRNGRCNGGSCA